MFSVTAGTWRCPRKDIRYRTGSVQDSLREFLPTFPEHGKQIRLFALGIEHGFGTRTRVISAGCFRLRLVEIVIRIERRRGGDRLIQMSVGIEVAHRLSNSLMSLRVSFICAGVSPCFFRNSLASAGVRARPY